MASSRAASTLAPVVVIWKGRLSLGVKSGCARFNKIRVWVLQLRASARDDKAGFIALLESSGFKSERCLLIMTRSLKEPISEP